MDLVRFGRDIRLLRQRRGWTQRRLAAQAKVSRWAAAEMEAGRGGRIAMEQLGRVVAALGGYLSMRIEYQGGSVDRLRDQRHAALVDQMVARLVANGWEVATEVSFNVYGDRGSIDILAFDPVTGALLVVEVKSVITDVGATLMALDRKVRHAQELAKARGWEARTVGRLLVLPETSTARRRVDDHEATFRNAFSARNVEVSRWLATPGRPISGLMFLSSARDTGTRRAKGTPAGSPTTRARTRRR
jgi:transcriptional regulator with XRE-family HTH domain